MKHKIKAVFYTRENRRLFILMGRRKSEGEEFWWIPGGSVEKDEDPLHALLRELQEELAPGPYLKKAIRKFYDKGTVPQNLSFLSGTTQYTILFVEVNSHVHNETVVVKEEFEELKWFAADALPANLSREFGPILHYLRANF